ncbi:hypothetical protein PG994_010482 [Apiospora phragmitis]|uniref:Polyamine transport protein n=1 Tax=Apiospora phragmitis TaxID=2905665 RepID=A0ABR1TQ49_9PEZI
MDQQGDHAETREQGSITDFEDPSTQHQLDRMPLHGVDVSPKTSLRPTPSNMSLTTASMRPDSIRSIGSKNASSRHALLKSEVSQQHSSEKDIPAPPILTQSDPLQKEGHTATTKVKTPSSTKEETTNNSSDKIDREVVDVNSKDHKPPGIVCIDPTLHAPGAHSKVHHLGLVSGADFCDAGTEVERDSPIGTPETQGSLSPPEIITGRVFRTLTGGDICEAEVDVSEHFHRDHSAMTKVRPAIQPIVQEELHSGHEGISKVRPADEGDTMPVVHQTRSTYDPPSSKPYRPESHAHQGHHPVSKVTQLLDRPSMEVEQPAISAPPEDPQSISHLSFNSPLTGHPILEEEESSKVASYWGDIPVSIGSQNETQGTTKESPLRSREASLEGSPLVNVDNSKQPWPTPVVPSAKSSLINEALEESDRTTSTVKRISKVPQSMYESQQPGSNTRSFSVHALQERLESQQLSTQRRRSTSHASRGLETISQENKPNHEAQSFLPEGLDPRRATQWLRELLKYKRSSQPQLTQLPEKMHPRHEKHSHQDSSDAPGKEVLTAVTTFSEKNAADADAINDAMANLEQLLSEALHIASNVTEPSGHCHVDNGELDPRHWYARKDIMSDLSRPASVHESLLGDLSEDDDHMPGFHTPPIVFIGAVEGLTHGCEALPLRSIERKGLLPPGIPRDQVTGPHLPRRKSSLHMRSIQQRDPSPVLPMPPPDSQLRRDSVYPARYVYVEDDPTRISKPHTKENVPNSREVREYIRVFHQPPVTSRGSSKSLGRIANLPGIPHKHQKRYTETRQIEADACSLDGGASDDKIDFGMPLPQRNAVKLSSTGANPPDHPHHNSTANPTRASLRQSAAKRAHELRNISLRGRSHVSIRDAQFSLTKSQKRQPIARDWSPIPVAMPLLFPQALAISTPRITYTSLWTTTLLLSRALMGVALGFASMNFHSILTDLFGASLMSRNPHGELVDYCDVRRHGGGLGVWLGIWTWCFIGSLGLGFLIGALVINTLQPSWGIYISIILIASVLILNVLTPEVRRSVWRRSVAEVKVGDQVSRRVARGEIMMHRVKDGPKWWGQEVYHGIALSLEMLRQPGFATMAVYLAWIYAQIVLIIVLLGSLTSRYYRLHSPLVGAAVSSVAIGALVAVPFQKANVFSRARYNPVATNSMTESSNLAWTSHLVRRAIFILVLPIAGTMYAVFSYGPPIPVAVPCFLAALVGFLSCLAISECNGMLMEAWDCSDLEPGMTGRSKSLKNAEKRTNYSSFPRVTAGYAVIHTFGFIFAAGATGIGGMARRNLGQRSATGVVAAILFFLTLLLISVLIRFRHVPIIPDSRTAEMEKWTQARRDSLRRRKSAIAEAKANGRTDLNAIPEEDVGWRPLVIGNPLDKCRRMNILELGSLTRWSEIRKKNRLIDEGTHLNRQALGEARTELGHRGMVVYGDLHRGGAMVGELVRKVSKRSLRSKRSDTSSDDEGDQKHMAGNIGPTGAGLGHSHASYPAELFTERECVMGQTVQEEGEESSSIDEPPQDAYVRSSSQDHKSHQMPKVQPYAGFEQQEVRGGMHHHSSADEQPDAGGGGREHASHMTTKVKETGSAGSGYRNTRGPHMKGKVKTTDVELESLGREHGAQNGKSSPANR